MKKCLVLLGVATMAVLLATSASAANRGVNFTGVGFISGPLCVAGSNAGNPCTTNADCPGSRCQVPASQVWDMDADGTTFLVSPSFSGGYAAFWTRDGGWGDLIGSASNFVLSDSGATVMANGIYPGSNPAYLWPGTWTGTTDVWSPIPADPGYAPCGSSRLSILDMSGEGDFAAGLTWQGCAIAQGFLWDKATNTTIGLGRPNGRSTRGNAVSADGSTVTGWGTIAQGLRRGAQWKNGTWAWFGDPNGEDVKECVQTGGGCTSNSGSPTSGCPEYVDDASCTGQGTCANRGTCQNRGTCVANVCVGGSNPGTTCTSNSQCRGTCTGGTNDGTTCTSDSVCAGACVGGTNPGTTCTSASACTGSCVGGPNNGANCSSNSSCPDTLVCANNPNWNDSLFKGEAYDATPDGQYACGRNFDFGAGFDAGYRANPDGTFTKLELLETWPYLVDPFRISDNGKVIVGNAGTRLSGTVPYMWIEGVGPIDLQLFLEAQGLDELYFWYLAQASTVNADGTVIGGYGFNPDGWQEGWIVDMKKIWVCHAPPGNPENARTLGIEFGSAADHVAHGDFLGTCEFLNSGALSRAVTQRAQAVKQFKTNSAQTRIDESTSPRDVPLSVVLDKGKTKVLKGARQKTSARD